MNGQEKILGKKKLGRPAIGKGVQINAMHRPEDVAALDAWIAAQPDPKPSRPEAIRVALKEWLTGLGLLKTPGEGSRFISEDASGLSISYDEVEEGAEEYYLG